MTEAALHKPRLATGVRLHWDHVLELCDGDRTIEAITDELNDRYDGGAVTEDVERLLGAIAARGLVIDADS
jgi:Coenzyme PQQ synthesis protein D (PqqD)